MQNERIPKWRLVEEDWYLKQYPSAIEEISAQGLLDAGDHYEAIGKSFGFSPNRYFDENWYRQAYPELYAEICRGELASGFDHYCTKGYATHAPHWLFSESYYLRHHSGAVNEAIASGLYCNGYDHFLETGDASGLGGTGSSIPPALLLSLMRKRVSRAQGEGHSTLSSLTRPRSRIVIVSPGISILYGTLSVIPMSCATLKLVVISRFFIIT